MKVKIKNWYDIQNQKYSRLRCLLHVKGLVVCFYLGWSGSTLLITKHLIEVGSKSWLLTLVWPQWWSFADVSQQGVDFSKKISKIRIIFWFDFHRCSHRLSKFRLHFRNKSHSILKLSKNVFYKKCGPKLTFFSEKQIQKDLNDFWHTGYLIAYLKK